MQLIDLLLQPTFTFLAPRQLFPILSSLTCHRDVPSMIPVSTEEVRKVTYLWSADIRAPGSECFSLARNVLQPSCQGTGAPSLPPSTFRGSQLRRLFVLNPSAWNLLALTADKFIRSHFFFAELSPNAVLDLEEHF